MGKKKDFLTREEQEKSENIKTQDVDVPESRFQTKQQIPDAMQAGKANGASTGFGKKRNEAKGAILKQEVAAQVIDQGVGGEVPASAVAVRGLSYSGNEGTILDSAAYTPIVGQSRSDSRTGKKLDAIAKKLNFIPSEQVEEVFDESKALAEDPSAVQGYNGTPRNTNARMQKNNGAVPGELLFQRSLDEIKRDQLYFSTGQVIRRDRDDLVSDTPTVVPIQDNNGVYHYDTGVDEAHGKYVLPRSNYLHRAMRIKFNSQGVLEKMTFDVLDASCIVNDDTILNASSANNTIDRNYAEVDRQRIDAKAGDEKADIWCPLARAVKQPTRTVGYLRDIENITGAEVFLAYKKTTNALSYQLNRAAKDGMKLVTPMAEALLGLTIAEQNSTTLSTYTTSDIFSTTAYRDGSASLYIAINDSVSKYNNKADILTQPRSIKLAVQAADNNMNPLRLKSDLVKVVNSREVFSTIDREYDPTMPVCISDRAALIHCYNFNDLYSFNGLSNGEPVFTKKPFLYMYSDLRNQYLVNAAIPLLAGMHKYLNSIGPKIVSLNNGALANQEIVIPMVHSTCYFSLWSLFLLSAVPFITRERVNSLKDILYYEKNVEYPFSQLISIREANPMNALQYGSTDYNYPLVVKRMTPSAALTWVLPEVFWPVHENTLSYKYVLPWYFNQCDFEYTGTAVNRGAGKYSMSMPSVRSGVRFGYLDDIYSMSERDVRLSLDRLTDIPTHLSEAGASGVYKYSQNADGIPFFTISDNQMTPTILIGLPRELGWFAVAPAGVLCKIPDNETAFGSFIANDGKVLAQTSYVAKFWHGRTNNSTAPSGILAKAAINVDRSTAYVQDWDAVTATTRFNLNEPDWGFVLSMQQLFDADSPIDGKGKFIPFTTGVRSNGAEGLYTSNDLKVMSLQKALWTRVQKLPFAISPFDMRYMDRNGSQDSLKFDPYDFLYYFGLSGFKASEYDEDVYNRSMTVINQGFLFLEDPFVKDSPLFKEAGYHTQSNNEASIVK